jgi:hypothetical protein
MLSEGGHGAVQYWTRQGLGTVSGGCWEPDLRAPNEDGTNQD